MIAATTASPTRSTWWRSRARAAQDRDQTLGPEHAPPARSSRAAPPSSTAMPGRDRAARQRQRQEREHGRGDGRDGRDQPGDQHRDAGRARHQRERPRAPPAARRASRDRRRPAPKRPSRTSAKVERRVGLAAGLHQEQRRRVPCWRAGSHQGRSSTGGDAEGDQGRVRGPRGPTAGVRVTAEANDQDDDRRARPRTPRPPARTRRPTASSSPVRQAARQRRSRLGVGEAERGVRQERQQHGERRPRPRRPSPNAPGGDRDQGVGDGAEGDQPAGRAAGVDQSADDAEQAPGAPQRERDGQQQQRGDGRGGAVAEHRAEDRRAPRRTPAPGPAVPGAERVPRLGPQVAAAGSPRAGGRGETAAGDVPERLTRAEHREHHDQRQGHGERVGEEAGDEPGVLLGRRRRRRPSGAGSGPGPRPPWPPAAVGDVLGLVEGRADDVADEVEAVPVGHPPRRRSSGRGGRWLAGRRCARARRAGGSRPG